MNFSHLTYTMLLHYVVKIKKKTKMHVNTSSAFNVNYKITAMHKITLTLSKNVLVNHINEHSCQHMFTVSTTSMHT